VAAPDFMLFCSRRNLSIGNPPKADKANTRSFSVSLSNQIKNKLSRITLTVSVRILSQVF